MRRDGCQSIKGVQPLKTAPPHELAHCTELLLWEDEWRVNKEEQISFVKQFKATHS